eukprot:m.13005 g.13005  ORF g.13005 m.13005 type:complete len:85 (+) comp24446_c0_seq1:120-374(+)
MVDHVETDGWMSSDRKGRAEKRALRLLGYNVTEISNHVFNGIVAKGAIIDGLTYREIWEGSSATKPPVIEYSKLQLDQANVKSS